jgi:cytochrome P450 RapN
MTDARFSRAMAVGKSVPNTQPNPPTGTQLMYKDPPEHSRLRAVVSREFTVRRVELLRPRCQELATSCWIR